MVEVAESKLTIPVVQGLEKPPALAITVEKTLTQALSSTPISKLIDTQREVMRETIYKPLLHPNPEIVPLTETGERNRQILLWAYDQQIPIPLKYLSQITYSNTETSQLLKEMFNAEELQRLQGALVYRIGHDIKDVDERNAVAFGGILYSQSPVDGEEEDYITDLLQRQFATPLGAFELNLLPAFLRKNVKGGIHVLPYGRAEKIEGKEKETLLMLADDMLKLIETFETSEVMGFPRFIMNGTNKTMGEAAKKYFGAHVSQLNEIEALIHVSVNTLMKTPGDPDNVVKVFVPEFKLRLAKPKLRKMREGLYEKIRGERDVSLPELLKEIRLDAINQICERQKFLGQTD